MNVKLAIATVADGRTVSANTVGRSGPTRSQAILWTVVLIVMVGLSLHNYDSFQIGTYGDDSDYIILSWSLISSHTYGMINVPGVPQAGRYPFGYPLLLTPMTLLFPGNLTALKVPSLIFTIVNASILFWGWRWLGGRRSYWWALALVALYAVDPMTVRFTRMTMSEPTFTTFCWLSLLLAGLGARGQGGRWWIPALSVTLLGALFTRTVGIIPVVVVLGYLLTTRGRRFLREGLAIIAVIGVLLGLVVSITPVQPKNLLPVEYLQDQSGSFLPTSIKRVLAESVASERASNSVQAPPISTTPLPLHEDSWLLRMLRYGVRQHLGKDLPGIVLAVGGGVKEQALASLIGVPLLPLLIGLLISGLVLLGMFRWPFDGDITVFILFAPIYFGALFLWIWDDPRFLYPIEPQLFLGFLGGIDLLVLAAGWLIRQQQRARAYGWAIIVGATLIVLTTSMTKSWTIDKTQLHVGDLALRTNWLKEHTDPTAIFMSEVPATDFIYSQRKTVDYPEHPVSAEQLEHYLDENRIRYILVAPTVTWQSRYQPVYSQSTRRLLPLVKNLEQEGRIKLVYRFPPDLIEVFAVER